MSEEEKPARKRRASPKEAESGSPPVQQPEPDEDGHVFRLNDDGSARLTPKATAITAKAERTVRTGQYESFTISTLATVEPDRRFTTGENALAINQLVTDKVNQIADEIQSKLSV